MPWKKKSAVLYCTIHSIHLSEPDPDLFFVEWKRGDHKGFTDKQLLTSDNSISFEKSFN